ncbi:MAG: hypothetical protein HGGPFJEG_01002 [Ignavibacteria bacterium]|nr:hypothetical protein [Ignavibacteria bacterium]
MKIVADESDDYGIIDLFLLYRWKTLQKFQYTISFGAPERTLPAPNSYINSFNCSILIPTFFNILFNVPFLSSL